MLVTTRNTQDKLQNKIVDLMVYLWYYVIKEVVKMNSKEFRQLLFYQLNELREEGYSWVVYPVEDCEMLFGLYGFDSCTPVAQQDYLEQKQMEYSELLAYQDECELGTFEEWLKEEEEFSNDIYVSIESLLNSDLFDEYDEENE